MYAQLLIDLFKFLAPFLRNADLNRAMQVLYKVTLIMYILLGNAILCRIASLHYIFRMFDFVLLGYSQGTAGLTS